MKPWMSVLLLATMLDDADCACSPCGEDIISETRSRAGEVAKVALRNCGATTRTVVAIYIDGKRTVVLDQDVPVHIEWIEWKDELRLAVDVPADLPDQKISYGNWEKVGGVVIRRRFK